jgi:glycosyltransferase involved in cell wall biosynthesis
MANAATVSIVIPTQRRPGPLALAARSALRQTGVDGAVELVVVDNDAVPSAQALVEALARDAPFAVVYVHEPRSGVANARNAGLERASGALIAFLDDDEEAPPHWLSALLQVQRALDADVVFGPVRGRAPAGPIRHRAYLEHFFSRLGPDQAGLIDAPYGCGDSLIRRAALPHPTRPFSASRNRTGGEDDLLFQLMKAQGARFAWAPDAFVWEDPAPERLTLSYALSRAYGYGQGPACQCAAASPPDWPGVWRWMLVGAGQTLVYGFLALLAAVARTQDRAFAFDRAARGLGKVFWGPPFKLHYYGR